MFFSLTSPRAKCLRFCRTSSIVVVVIVVALMVVAVEIFDLSALTLSLIPHQIDIYPLPPDTHTL